MKKLHKQRFLWALSAVILVVVAVSAFASSQTIAFAKAPTEETVFAGGGGYNLTIRLNANIESITVQRGSLILKMTYTESTTVLIPEGTKITWTAKAAAGYDPSPASGVFAMTEPSTISPTAVPAVYNLSIEKNTGVSAIVVSRSTTNTAVGATPGTLNNGSTVYYGDQLYVQVTAATGFTVSPASYYVTVATASDAVVSPTATPNAYSLTLTKNAGISDVTVSRTSSPYKGAATGTLSNGATIYYGDVLTVSATAATGYQINTSSYSSTVTVGGNVTVAPTTTVKAYTLTLTLNTGISRINVTRVQSPNKGAASGGLSNGATIYHGDVLTVSVTAAAGYQINTSSYTSTITVSGNVTVAPTATAKVFTVSITSYAPSNATVLDFVWTLQWNGTSLGNVNDYVNMTVSQDGQSVTLTLKKDFSGSQIRLICKSNYTGVFAVVQITCGR